MKKPIYLDYQSTTPMDPRVFVAMKPYFTEDFGNAGSHTHLYGEIAEQAVKSAREEIANMIHADKASEIIFTSGATESNNIAIQGIARQLKKQGKMHVITSAIEHKAVLDVVAELGNNGFEITYLKPDIEGLLSVDELKENIKKTTGLISIMHANNEIGVINPIDEIGQIALENGIYFHCDAAQTFGKLPINVKKMNIHLLSISGHKIYGPKGIGALYVSKFSPEVSLQPIIFGGGQENGLRSGTLSVPLIVGFAKAGSLAIDELSDESIRLTELRNYLLAGLLNISKDVLINGSIKTRLPNNLNVSFMQIESETLMMNLYQDIAVSNGSACTSASWEGSYVLKALGHGKERIDSAIRFGIGRFTTQEHIDFAISCISDKVKYLSTTMR